MRERKKGGNFLLGQWGISRTENRNIDSRRNPGGEWFLKTRQFRVYVHAKNKKNQAARKNF